MTRDANTDPILSRELEYHERLYSGFAQSHFARPAVRALRAHMVSHLLRVTGAGPSSRVLSLGCGIGDTEILLAPHVGELVGVDLAPTAVRQACMDAERAGLRNTRFVEGSIDAVEGTFDTIIAIFFLHHLPDAILESIAGNARALLRAGGRFYSLDPSRYRLSGMIGRLLVPGLMRKYQSPDERELEPQRVLALFRAAGFDARAGYYDFFSSPMAGLFPGCRTGYRAARLLDELLIRTPALRRMGSNFEIVAAKLD